MMYSMPRLILDVWLIISHHSPPEKMPSSLFQSRWRNCGSERFSKCLDPARIQAPSYLPSELPPLATMLHPLSHSLWDYATGKTHLPSMREQQRWHLGGVRMHFYAPFRGEGRIVFNTLEHQLYLGHWEWREECFRVYLKSHFEWRRTWFQRSGSWTSLWANCNQCQRECWRSALADTMWLSTCLAVTPKH